MMQDSSDATIMIVGFFMLGALAAGFVGIRYLLAKEKLFKIFGLGMLLDALAFGVWAAMVAIKPEQDIITLVTGVGVGILIASFIAYFLVVISQFKKRGRLIAMIVGALALAVLLPVRFIFFESQPHFSDTGLFSFDVAYVVIYAYVILMSFTVMPAAYLVSGKIKSVPLRHILRFGLTLIVISMVILITTPNLELQTVNGFGMAAGFLSLGIGHLIFELNPVSKSDSKNIRKK